MAKVAQKPFVTPALFLPFRSTTLPSKSHLLKSPAQAHTGDTLGALPSPACSIQSILFKQLVSQSVKSNCLPACLVWMRGLPGYPTLSVHEREATADALVHAIALSCLITQPPLRLLVPLHPPGGGGRIIRTVFMYFNYRPQVAWVVNLFLMNSSSLPQVSENERSYK